MPISRVQIASITGASVTGLTLAFPGPVTAGNVLVAFAGSGVSQAFPDNVGIFSDSQGNAWHGIANPGSLSDNTIADSFWTIAGASGPDSVTVTAFNTVTPAGMSLIIAEYTGMVGTTFDAAQENEFGVGPSANTGPITTGNFTDLLIAFAVDGGNHPAAAAWAVDSGFTLGATTSDGVGGNYAYAERIVTASGTFNPTFSGVHAGNTIVAAIGALIGGPPGPGAAVSFEIGLWGAKRRPAPHPPKLELHKAPPPHKLFE